MISVGPGRALTGCGGWQSVKGIRQKHHIHGLRPVIGLLRMVPVKVNCFVRLLLTSLR